MGGIMAYGWPILYNIGVGTLSAICRTGAPDSGRDPEKQRSNLGKQKEGGSGALRFALRGAAKGKLSAILFPKISDSPHGLRRIDPESALAHLQESCYTPNDPNFINWHQYVTYDAAWETQNAQTLMETMVRSVPCYELKWKEEIQLL